jgi:hypothetical protein
LKIDTTQGLPSQKSVSPKIASSSGHYMRNARIIEKWSQILGYESGLWNQDHPRTINLIYYLKNRHNPRSSLTTILREPKSHRSLAITCEMSALSRYVVKNSCMYLDFGTSSNLWCVMCQHPLSHIITKQNLFICCSSSIPNQSLNSRVLILMSSCKVLCNMQISTRNKNSTPHDWAHEWLSSCH